MNKENYIINKENHNCNCNCNQLINSELKIKENSDSKVTAAELERPDPSLEESEQILKDNCQTNNCQTDNCQTD